MAEARSRELAEWIQEGTISKVREHQEVPRIKAHVHALRADEEDF